MRGFGFTVPGLIIATTLTLTPPAVEAPAAAKLLEWWHTHGRTPVDYTISRFDKHDWVFLGEYHRIQNDVLLVVELIPRLHTETRVRHLALEVLCSASTSRANELLTAGSYDRRAAIDFFRTQFPAWGYEEYLEIFRSVWRSNRDHAAERGPFHLVGLNPCPDYELMHHGTEKEASEERDKQENYDRHMAAILEEQLLRRDLPALIFTGIAHSTAKYAEYRYGTDEQLMRMGNLVYRKPHRDRMFFIALHAPFWDAGTDKEIYPFDGVLDRLMASYGRPIGFDVVDSPFAALLHEKRSPRAITAYSFGELYDGYIMWNSPLKNTVGVTCIADWIVSEEQYVHFWRHLSNPEASRRFAELPFKEYLADRCAPRPDHGPEFARRFSRLPDLD